MPRPLRKGERDPRTGMTDAEKARKENAERLIANPPPDPPSREEK